MTREITAFSLAATLAVTSHAVLVDDFDTPPTNTEAGVDANYALFENFDPNDAVDLDADTLATADQHIRISNRGTSGFNQLKVVRSGSSYNVSETEPIDMSVLIEDIFAGGGQRFRMGFNLDPSFGNRIDFELNHFGTGSTITAELRENGTAVATQSLTTAFTGLPAGLTFAGSLDDTNLSVSLGAETLTFAHGQDLDTLWAGDNGFEPWFAQTTFVNGVRWTEIDDLNVTGTFIPEPASVGLMMAGIFAGSTRRKRS